LRSAQQPMPMTSSPSGGMIYGILSMDSFAVGVGTSGNTLRARVRHRTESTDLSDDTVAAICHPLQSISPEVQP
jgi:hypothetical protein